MKGTKMVFLIEYNRREGRLVSFETFEDGDRERAENARLTLELDLNRRGVDHEVVILEAKDEETMRKTHGRYFYTLEELITASGFSR